MTASQSARRASIKADSKKPEDPGAETTQTKEEFTDSASKMTTTQDAADEQSSSSDMDETMRQVRHASMAQEEAREREEAAKRAEQSKWKSWRKHRSIGVNESYKH